MLLLIIVTRSLSRLSLAACDWVSPEPSLERTCDDVLGSRWRLNRRPFA
jgi:hypothetical protein